MKIQNAAYPGIFIQDFKVEPGEAWCVLGANRSGIEAFFSLLAAKGAGAVASCCEIPHKLALVSFKQQQQIYEAELKNDDSDFLDRIDPGTLACEFIADVEESAELITAFNLQGCLDQGFRELSSGQTRKLLLLVACTDMPECLLIEAPYEGLDQQGRTELNQALQQLHQRGSSIVLFITNRSDIPSWAGHLELVGQGQLLWQGNTARCPAHMLQNTVGGTAGFRAAGEALNASASAACSATAPLVQLRQGHAAYRGTDVFRHLELSIYPGQHTLVTGSNGSGKSTLLQVLSGDHPACYKNELHMFGIKRGSGESIWDIKKNLGIVSSALHRSYHVNCSALECVVSGFFDSIGVYRQPDWSQRQQARAWLQWLGLLELQECPFRALDYADQRLLLIARALIKNPPLLILDEPTQGLDEANRHAVLDFVAQIAARELSTVVYVSHREDEQRPFFTQHLNMDQYSTRLSGGKFKIS